VGSSSCNDGSGNSNSGGISSLALVVAVAGVITNYMRLFEGKYISIVTLQDTQQQ